MLKKKKFVISIVLGIVLSIAVVGGVVFASDAVSRNIKVIIYTPNSNADGIVKSTATVSKIRPTLIIKEMSKKIPELKNVRALGFVQNKGHIDLNLSEEFEKELCKYGTAGEYMLMGSVVNTFLEACNASTISIRVKGHIIETGHCIYSEPLEFYK